MKLGQVLRFDHRLDHRQLGFQLDPVLYRLFNLALSLEVIPRVVDRFRRGDGYGRDGGIWLGLKEEELAGVSNYRF